MSDNLLISNGEIHCVCATLGCGGAALCSFGTGVARPHPVSLLARGDRLRVGNGACSTLHVVRRGLLAACAMTPDGRRQILHLNFAGDTVCPMSAEGAEGWCEALAETELCLLDFAENAEGLKGDPAFVWKLFRLAHARLEQASGQILTLGRFDGIERMCSFLAEITRRTGRSYEECWRVSLPMSREDIADYLGLNAATVSRLLGRLKRDGLVKFVTPSEFDVPCLGALEARVPIALVRRASSAESIA